MKNKKPESTRKYANQQMLNPNRSSFLSLPVPKDSEVLEVHSCSRQEHCLQDDCNNACLSRLVLGHLETEREFGIERDTTTTYYAEILMVMIMMVMIITMMMVDGNSNDNQTSIGQFNDNQILIDQ